MRRPASPANARASGARTGVGRHGLNRHLASRSFRRSISPCCAACLYALACCPVGCRRWRVAGAGGADSIVPVTRPGKAGPKRTRLLRRRLGPDGSFFTSAKPCAVVPPPSRTDALPAVTRRLTLRQAEDYALANQPRLAASVLNSQAEVQRVYEARSAFFPAGAGRGGGRRRQGRQQPSGRRRPVSPIPTILSRQSDGVLLSQLITDFGRTYYLTTSARSRALSAAQRAQVEKELLLFRVDRAYFAVQGAQSLLEVAEPDRLHGQPFARTHEGPRGQRAQVKFGRELRRGRGGASPFAPDSSAGALCKKATLIFRLLWVWGGRLISRWCRRNSAPNRRPNVGPFIAESLAHRPDLLAARNDRDAALPFCEGRTRRASADRHRPGRLRHLARLQRRRPAAQLRSHRRQHQHPRVHRRIAQRSRPGGGVARPSGAEGRWKTRKRTPRVTCTTPGLKRARPTRVSPSPTNCLQQRAAGVPTRAGPVQRGHEFHRGIEPGAVATHPVADHRRHFALRLSGAPPRAGLPSRRIKIARSHRGQALLRGRRMRKFFLDRPRASGDKWPSWERETLTPRDCR